MKPTRVYQCEDSVEGILTAVYDAGVSRYGHDYIRIQAQSLGLVENIDLFSEYIQVENDLEKVEKVQRSVRTKISEEAYTYIMRAVCSMAEDKADAIYHYIVYGFSLGARITRAVQLPCVQRIFEMDRMISNEVHHYLGFLRFQEIQRDPAVLLSIIEPKNQILAMVTEHFADRLNAERFIIFDKTHGEASFHSADGQWFLRRLEKEEADRLIELSQTQEELSDLWKVFFESICIKERENSDLQRNNIPLRYRGNMPEFQ